MALSKVTVNKGGGLGRRLNSKDGISGLLFYNDTLPSGFSASDRVKKVFSLEEAETLGIAEGSADHDVEQYHISEFFRLNPSGELWLGYFAVPVGAYDYAEVTTMQNVAKGEIRLLGVYTPDDVFATADVTALQAVLTVQDGLNQPIYAVLAPDLSGTADFATLADLRTLNAPDVGVCIGQDDAGRGASIFTTLTQSVTCVGALIGAMSKAKVSQSVANPENFNLAGPELTVPGFSNGDAYRDYTETAAAGIKDKGYAIIRDRLPGLSGTYFERIPSAVPATNDFAFQENRRVIQKAQRDLVTVYTPKLNSTILLNSDGTISDVTIEAFRNLGRDVLETMIANGDLSDGDIQIDPDQDVLSTSTLVITARLLPLGVAEFITLNINLVTELT